MNSRIWASCAAEAGCVAGAVAGCVVVGWVVGSGKPKSLATERASSGRFRELRMGACVRAKAFVLGCLRPSDWVPTALRTASLPSGSASAQRPGESRPARRCSGTKRLGHPSRPNQTHDPEAGPVAAPGCVVGCAAGAVAGCAAAGWVEGSGRPKRARIALASSGFFSASKHLA